MLDTDFAKATFEYILRNNIKEEKIPNIGAVISCDSHYYIVDWKDVTLQTLWSKIIDEKDLSKINEEKLEDFFIEKLNIFSKTLSVTDAKYLTEKKLSELKNWKIVKNVPKKYYKG